MNRKEDIESKVTAILEAFGDAGKFKSGGVLFESLPPEEDSQRYRISYRNIEVFPHYMPGNWENQMNSLAYSARERLLARRSG